MSFPAALPSYTTADPTKTLDADNHTQRHNSTQDDIIALAGKVGVNGSGVTTSHDYLISHLRTDFDARTAATPSTAEMNAAIAAAIATAKSALMPIGSYYTNETDSTNPGTLLGFGTWAAVTNRFIVGKGSGTFVTAGGTGGAETVVLTATNLPAQIGSILLHSSGTATNVAGATGVFAAAGTNANNYRDGGTNNAGAASIGGVNYDNGGASTPVNKLPPYIIAYIWKRTA